MNAALSTGPASSSPLLHALAANWWLFLLRGVFAVVFGVMALAWPGPTVVVLVLVFGAWAVADGVLALVAAARGGGLAPRWWLALVGAAGVAAGLFAFLQPGLTAIALLIFIAAWAVVTGVMQVVGALRMRHEIDNEWWLVAGGALSVVFGVLMLWAPGAGALALVLVIGAWAIVYGALLVGFALRLRRHR